LYDSLVPDTINATSFTPAITCHLKTNNVIFCTALQFAALNNGLYLVANDYNRLRIESYREWTEKHTEDNWPEDAKIYLLYLLLLGPTLVAMTQSNITRFNPDPAAHLAMV
jgi:hypothetical protein